MRIRSSRIQSAVTAAGVVVALLLLVPAAVALAAGATTITVHERGIDVNPGDQNPCSGATGTVIDVNDIHFHITTLPDGTINETGHDTASVTFTPDDPTQPAYEGQETYAFSQNTTNQRLVTTMTFHLRMKGTDGSFLTIREIAHTTINQTGATTIFDKPILICS